ncbi:MAG: Transposase [Candidatus Moranbacteria bacterium GW2011_GWF2_34_56]|nr:MAG: Transposase [Candidatus Moranbacteria bacterium GW2011_GWF1_34_10]KKP64097.1 MAG: Transposase [Candidatus Moranbacteria bacterium GW2011_GWF2_34_56]
MRKIIFANGEYYHIYNRGVDKRDVFMNDDDYMRFLLCMNLLNDKNDGLMLLWRDLQKNNQSDPKAQPLARQRLSLRNPIVEIIAYCLNPNHYHFILKQLEENGITKFMHKLSTSYTMYFNKKYERSGALFQGKFKSIHIDTNEYLLHLSAYVNNNNFIHGYDEEKDWQYSSYLNYVGKRNGKLCNKEVILGQFKNQNNQGSTLGAFKVEPFKNYQDFMDKTGEYFKDKKELERYLLEY